MGRFGVSPSVRFGVFPVAALLLWAAVGCDTLPDGTPPDGSLVDNTPPPADSALARHNRLVTQLVAFALASGLSELSAADDGIAPAVARDASRIVGFTLRSGAGLRLFGVRKADGKVELVLRSSDGAVCWSSGD